MSEQPRRIAVVVFCEVESAGQEDAEVVATLAVRRAIASEGRSWPSDISIEAYGHHFPVLAVRAMDVGMACGNGYLWTTPTSKAFLEGRRGS